MEDQRVRDMLTAMLTTLDPDAEHALRHEDFVADMPQSGERIRGRDDLRSMQRAFPPDRAPSFEVRRITGGGDVWTVEAVGDYGGRSTSWSASSSCGTTGSSVRRGPTHSPSSRRVGERSGWSAWTSRSRARAAP
jgi:hypothetical protein